jgi:hypothetical protein
MQVPRAEVEREGTELICQRTAADAWARLHDRGRKPRVMQRSGSGEAGGAGSDHEDIDFHRP